MSARWPASRRPTRNGPTTARSTARSWKLVRAWMTRQRSAVALAAGQVRTAERRAERFVCSGRRPAVAPAPERG
jgi:hypothetical protein